jgi:predicted DNA-binding transcriptional regulator YafY
MTNNNEIFSNNFLHIIQILHCMTQPNGTSINELCQKLKITRRSIFRMINMIENKFHIPIEVKRETFGGTATYKVDSSFIEKLSSLTIPKTSLTFEQSLIIYLLLDNSESVLQSNSE